MTRASIGVSVALIFLGLIAGGAGQAAPAALLSCVLLAQASLVLAMVPIERLNTVLRRNWLALGAGLIFVVCSAISAWIVPEDAPAPWPSLWHPMWTAFGLHQGAISISPYRTLEGVVAFLAPASAFVLGALNTRESADRDWTGSLVVGFSLCYALYGLSLLFLDQSSSHERFNAGFNSANSAATIFGAFFLIATAQLIRVSRKKRNARSRQSRRPIFALVGYAPLSLAALLVCFACVMLTGSRAGLASLLAAFAILTVTLVTPALARGRRAPAGVFLLLASLVMGLILFGASMIASRMTSLEIDVEARQTLLEMHWRAFLDRPLLGHGLNTFHEINALYATPDTWFVARNAGAAHNVFVQLLEETGLLGAALVAAMLAAPIWRALSRAISGAASSVWAATGFSLVVLFLVHGSVDFTLNLPAAGALMCYLLAAFAGCGDWLRPRARPTDLGVRPV